MLAAVAAGSAGGGYDSLDVAVTRMAPHPSRVYEPNPNRASQYETLYREYKRLYDYFGRGENDVMRALRARRSR